MLRDGPMIYPLLHWLVSALSLLATAYIVPGFKIKDFSSALIAAFIIGLANIVIRPILLFLTFPINILTLGLFTFVVDGVILKMCAAVLKGFEISSWMAAIFGAMILALVGTILHLLLI